MASVNKEYLYCTSESKNKIQDISKKLRISQIRLLDIIMRRVKYNDCRKWHDEELNKERDGIK